MGQASAGRDLLSRLAGSVIGAVLLAILGVAGLIAFPEPLFPYYVTAGRLTLRSDQPFDAGAGRRVLEDVERRLALAPPQMSAGHGRYRIFVANAGWRRRLTFLWNYGAGGVNYYPIGGGVFVRRADIDRDRVFQTNGEDVPPPRTLAYYAAHEIGHTLVAQRVGALGNWRLARWIREGASDYVAFGGDVDVDAMARQLRAGDRDMDPKASGLYARYRLMVAYMLTREGWSIDQLLLSDLSQADAERRLLAPKPKR